ncbi:hypothetical protein HMI54_005584 [Coelomomyces lativittatus]|nr:hypothetical protein HMI55_007118 [Coelomomyces lativittatus]KAJ1511347.1 hypothetical protein HMI56_005507 [Coelomomyces lativittatus]KAJ1517436.1 hypothetical protein HMI54_005584 [Coelomomyces lativittatus]
MSSPFLPPLLLMDSIDTLVTEDLLPFLRFAAGLKNYSFFFCFSPSLHPSSHLLAIQHFTQGYVQLIPLPRKHSMIDAKDIWSQSKNVHVQLSQCRCEVYLKRPRGKWVNEINGFELHEKKSHVSLETKHSSFLHSSPSDSNASFSTTTTSTATSSSTSMWSSTILPYQEEVEDGNQLHDPYFMEPKPRDPSSLFTQPSINKPSESLLNTMDPEGWKRTALQPQEIQLEPPPPNKTHGPSPPTFPSTSSSSSSSLPFDLEGLTFDLSLTPRQKEARAQVKLPFLEAQSDSGFIHYAYDINDDFDDDDPDADLEF